MPHIDSEPGWLSVTEVISLGIPKVSVSKKGRPYFYLERWRGKIGNEQADMISDNSKKIGTYVHAEIERRFEQKDYTQRTDDRSMVMVNNLWNKFIIPYEVKPIVLEQTYKNEVYKLQGTVDVIADTNKWNNVTGDWKTSKQLDSIGGPLQLSMYDFLRGGDGKGFTGRMDKEKDVVEAVWYENLISYNPIWKAAMKVARYIKFGEVI